MKAVLSKSCQIGGCQSAHYARALCRKHYARQRRHGDPNKLKQRQRSRAERRCVVVGCEAPHRARGLCQNHYRRRSPIARPILLDLYCGAGGATRGYQEAGFEVWGVDSRRQPNYVGDRFIQMDVLEFLRALLAGSSVVGVSLEQIDAFHASPPCQAHSDLQKQSKRAYPEFVAPTREALRATGKPYVIENVEGAPLLDPIRICGASVVGLRVIRHRLFESNVPLVGVGCPERHPLCFTWDKRQAHYGKLDQNSAYITVTGSNSSVPNKLDAMGIDWMTGPQVNQAIPPAYARHVGLQLVDAIKAARVGAPGRVSSVLAANLSPL